MDDPRERLMDTSRIVKMGDTELETHVETCRLCMKLLEERLGVMVEFTVSRGLRDLSPESRSEVPDRETLEAAAYKRDAYHYSRLYVFQNEVFPDSMKFADGIKGFAAEKGLKYAREVLCRGTELKKLFGVKGRPAGVGKRVDLEYEAYVYMTLMDAMSSDKWSVICAGRLGRDVRDPDSILVLDGQLPREMCPRPEFDLRLNAAMPEFKEVAL